MLCKGTEIYGIGSVIKLYARGCPDMLFVCFEDGALASWLRDRGNRVAVLDGVNRLGLTRGLGRIRIVSALRQVHRTARLLEPSLAREGVELVHAHWYPHWLVAGLLRRRGYRSVWQINNFRNPGPLLQARTALHHRVARRGADLLLPASEYIAREWRGSGVPTAVVRNAAPGRLPAPAHPPSPPLRCLAAGRLLPQKGHHVAIEAVLTARARGHDVRLDVYGGPVEGNPYAAALERLKAPAGDAVRMLGFDPDLRDRQPDYHLALQCRIDPEPCSVWVCEALVDGLAVLASATGGTPELVDDGVTGYLYPPGESAPLARRLEELAREPDRLRTMKEAAFARSSRDLSLDRFVSETLAAYRAEGRDPPPGSPPARTRRLISPG